MRPFNIVLPSNRRTFQGSIRVIPYWVKLYLRISRLSSTFLTSHMYLPIDVIVPIVFGEGYKLLLRALVH
jgi:hypothetical protein